MATSHPIYCIFLYLWAKLAMYLQMLTLCFNNIPFFHQLQHLKHCHNWLNNSSWRYIGRVTREKSAASLKIKERVILPLLNQTKMPHPTDIPTGAGASQLNTHAVKYYLTHTSFKSLLTLTLFYHSCILPGQSSTDFLSLSLSLTVSCKQHTFSCCSYLAAEVQKERWISVQVFKNHAVLYPQLISYIYTLYKAA